MMKKGDIVLGKDLKPGMAVQGVQWRHAKLIVGVDLDGTDTIYEGEPNVSFYDLNDPWYGPCSTCLVPEDEFEIIREPNTKEYNEVVEVIRKSLEDNIKATLGFVEELGKLTEEYIK